LFVDFVTSSESEGFTGVFGCRDGRGVLRDAIQLHGGSSAIANEDEIMPAFLEVGRHRHLKRATSDSDPELISATAVAIANELEAAAVHRQDRPRVDIGELEHESIGNSMLASQEFREGDFGFNSLTPSDAESHFHLPL
jgi:hypothetical protein